MLREIRPDLERWRARGERFAFATVVATRRSSPRPVGSTLAVSERGELAGSVSGGCVESDVAVAAHEVLAGGPPGVATYGIADDAALEIGLPCGGEIDVFVYEPSRALVDWVLDDAASDGATAALVRMDGAAAGDATTLSGRAVWDTLGGVVRNRVVEREGGRVFAYVDARPPRLVVFGAVDLAQALCAAAKTVGWTTVVADPRARFATRERLPAADEVVVAWPEDVLRRIPLDAATAVVVLTHEDRFDVPALVGALDSDAFYVGAIGSRRTQERRRDRLRDAGVDDDALERLAGPCGLDIGGDAPAETAISILAEILAVRAGRDGGRLRDTGGRIHADVT